VLSPWDDLHVIDRGQRYFSLPAAWLLLLDAAAFAARIKEKGAVAKSHRARCSPLWAAEVN
jgi:hypothetical protein